MGVIAPMAHPLTSAEKGAGWLLCVFLELCVRVGGSRGAGGAAPPPFPRRTRIGRRGAVMPLLDAHLSIVCCSGSYVQCTQHSRGATEALLPSAHMSTPFELAQERDRALRAERNKASGWL